MVARLFIILYRAHLRILEKRINPRQWDAELSKAIDCLTYLIEYFKGRGVWR